MLGIMSTLSREYPFLRNLIPTTKYLFTFADHHAYLLNHVANSGKSFKQI